MWKNPSSIQHWDSNSQPLEREPPPITTVPPKYFQLFLLNQNVDTLSLVGATMGTPADVVKARIMNQPTDSSGRGTTSDDLFGGC